MYPAMLESVSPIAFPEKFQGAFARKRPSLEPLIREARASLRTLLIPSVIEPYYTYGVLEHAQPSFVLAPLMFLAMAESQGGITDKHREYLPAFLLMVELIGILDDTVDHTPFRSGRQAYWRRFGAPSAAPFSCFLFNAALDRTRATAPELVPLVTDMFSKICAAEVWEHDSRYPEATVESLGLWLGRHYDAVPAAIAHSLDGALLLHGRAPLDPEVCRRFAELQQDVDDIVNFVEQRELDGENDDLKMGIVTHPLLAAVRDSDAAAAALETMWAPRREALREAPSPERESAQEPDVELAYATLAQRIEMVGIPSTLLKIAADAEAAIAAADESTRECVADLVWTFVERLCRAESLRPAVERICPAVRGLR